MPKPTSIASIAPADLAYAVDRLIANGKTTAPEVIRLAGERVQRIAALEAELLALTGGGRTRARTCEDGETDLGAEDGREARAEAEPLAEARAFRRVQGQYAGYLRGSRCRPHADQARSTGARARRVRGGGDGTLLRRRRRTHGLTRGGGAEGENGCEDCEEGDGGETPGEEARRADGVEEAARDAAAQGAAQDPRGVHRAAARAAEGGAGEDEGAGGEERDGGGG